MTETKRQRYIRNIKFATMFKDQDTMIKISVKAAREICDLLEEQEPRVMTLDEVYNLHRGDCIYLEIRDGIECNALMLYACENYYVDFRSTDYKTISKDTSLYQKRWRVWTSRPTEEQRKNTPWGPLKEEDYD